MTLHLHYKNEIGRALLFLDMPRDSFIDFIICKIICKNPTSGRDLYIGKIPILPQTVFAHWKSFYVPVTSQKIHVNFVLDTR